MVSGVWQTKFSVSPGSGNWSLVLGPLEPDLEPDQDLTWDLDLSLTITYVYFTAPPLICGENSGLHMYVPGKTLIFPPLKMMKKIVMILLIYVFFSY